MANFRTKAEERNGIEKCEWCDNVLKDTEQRTNKRTRSFCKYKRCGTNYAYYENKVRIARNWLNNDPEGQQVLKTAQKYFADKREKKKAEIPPIEVKKPIQE